MVASTAFTINPIYLDCTERFATSGGVAMLEDDTNVNEGDSRTVSVGRRPVRSLQSWQLSFVDNNSEDPNAEDDAKFIWKLYRIVGKAEGFLFVPPNEEDRVQTDQPLRNSTKAVGDADAFEGDGSTTTFQLMFSLSMDHDIGSGSSAITPFDVNYPLEDTVVVYADGLEVSIAGVSETTGVVTLTVAPADGAVMTADYERAIPVRFTSDSVARTLFEGVRSEMRSVQFKEIP